MELKPGFSSWFFCDYCLLIVPYGIETKVHLFLLLNKLLLIVPYGIETQVLGSFRTADQLF